MKPRKSPPKLYRKSRKTIAQRLARDGTRISVRPSAELGEALRLHSLDQHQSRSQIVQRALEKVIPKETVAKAKALVAKARGKAREASPLVGRARKPRP